MVLILITYLINYCKFITRDITCVSPHWQYQLVIYFCKSNYWFLSKIKLPVTQTQTQTQVETCLQAVI